MGLYRRYLAPHVVDAVCSPPALGVWRSRVVADLVGTVVEIGFGAGRNLPFYPSSVTGITAIEPSSIMRRKAQRRIPVHAIPVRFGGLDGQDLAVPSNEFDAAVITFSLCTIPDPLRALRELRRVVRPGGELRILEHGLSPDASVARWQHRLDGVEQRVADGCHLTRDPSALVSSSGWEITDIYQRYAPGPKPWCYFTSLRAQ
jgi:SAM-dependent methyltransferase